MNAKTKLARPCNATKTSFALSSVRVKSARFERNAAVVCQNVALTAEVCAIGRVLEGPTWSPVTGTFAAPSN